MQFAIEARACIQWTGSNESEFEDLSGIWFGTEMLFEAEVDNGVMALTVTYSPNEQYNMAQEVLELAVGDWIANTYNGYFAKVSAAKFAERFILAN